MMGPNRRGNEGRVARVSWLLVMAVNVVAGVVVVMVVDEMRV